MKTSQALAHAIERLIMAVGRGDQSSIQDARTSLESELALALGDTGDDTVEVELEGLGSK